MTYGLDFIRNGPKVRARTFRSYSEMSPTMTLTQSPRLPGRFPYVKMVVSSTMRAAVNSMSRQLGCVAPDPFWWAITAI